MLTHRHPSQTLFTGTKLVRGVALCVVAAVIGWGSTAQAFREHPAPDLNSPDLVPLQVRDVGIDDHAGQELPKGIMLNDEDGKSVLLDSYFSDGKPVVMVLAYYSCPMLCTVVLNGMNTGLRQLDWTLGREYRVVTVSIDPRDTPEIAKGKRDNYLRDYGRQVDPSGWHFLTGDEANVKRLAKALGFKYHWDAANDQYAHAAGAFILTPGEKISRTFYGISFQPKDLRMALVEASNGNYTSALDKILLFCFHYDANAGKYTLAVTRLMKWGAALTALTLGFVLARFWKKDGARPQA